MAEHFPETGDVVVNKDIIIPKGTILTRCGPTKKFYANNYMAESVGIAGNYAIFIHVDEDVVLLSPQLFQVIK